ncbi:MAG: hypothetical protein R2795_21895 [Saprospiraceae bacterium]
MDGNFELNPTTYLDTDRLAMACRIRIRRGKQDWQPQAEVIKHARSQKDISDYFLNWLAIESPISNKDLTEQFRSRRSLLRFRLMKKQVKLWHPRYSGSR